MVVVALKYIYVCVLVVVDVVDVVAVKMSVCISLYRGS